MIHPLDTMEAAAQALQDARDQLKEAGGNFNRALQAAHQVYGSLDPEDRQNLGPIADAVMRQNNNGYSPNDR